MEPAQGGCCGTKWVMRKPGLLRNQMDNAQYGLSQKPKMEMHFFPKILHAGRV